MSKTFQELLLALSDLDKAAEVQFDATEVVEDLRDKVDTIYTVLERLQIEAARLSSNADKFKTASKQIEAQADRLREYVSWNMQQQGFEKLPGRDWRLQLQKTSAVEIRDNVKPGATEALALPDFVRRKVDYAWNKEAIKEHLAKGGEFQYGQLVENKSCRFYINKGSAS